MRLRKIYGSTCTPHCLPLPKTHLMGHSGDSNKANRAKIRQIVRFATSVAAMVVFGGLIFAHFATYNTGVRSGVVIDIREEGRIFRTVEGELSMMGTDTSANPKGFLFQFSVIQRDPAVRTELDKALEHQERVNLHYKEKYAVIPWLGKTKYVVVAVERRQPDSEVERPRIDQAP